MSSNDPFSPAKFHQVFHQCTPAVLVIVLITVSVVVLGGWFCFCFRRKLLFFPAGNRKQSSLGKFDAKEMNLRHFTLEELQKATKNFSQCCLIGSGAYGSVYCGSFELEGYQLAVKKPHTEPYTTIHDFRNEASLLSKVKHKNLVQLVGFCEGPKAEKILVYEFVPNGSLLDYITGRKGRSLTWKERANIAIGAAKGIAHLHEGISPSIIHRDIKPSNILIGEGFEAKVSDFGTVRSGPSGDQSHVSSEVKGTPGYLDPAYCLSSHLTPFTDVYSFGVILMQLVTARPALESDKSNTNSHIIDWARPSIEKGSIQDILDINLLLQGCSLKMMLEMGRIALRCVAKVPKERPRMSQVWQELEAALKSADESMPKQTLKNNVSDNELKICKPHHSCTNQDCSCSITLSLDGIALERFHVDIDALSFESASLRCLEGSINMKD